MVRKLLPGSCFVLVIAAVAAFVTHEVLKQPAPSTLVVGGRPQGYQTVTVLTNEGFEIGYSELRGNPLWVMYEVTATDFPIQTSTKPWEPDARTEAKVNVLDYACTGYQPVQMAASRTIRCCHGESAQEQAFLMSNICPQLPETHYLWTCLEDYVRACARTYGSVWVLAGPVFDQKASFLLQDPECASSTSVSVAIHKHIEIPDAFYMIVLDQAGGGLRALTFLLPQGAQKDLQLEDLLVSIDRIETLTDLDFIPSIDDEYEEYLESVVPPRLWHTSSISI